MKVTVRYQYDPTYGKTGYQAFIDLHGNNLVCGSGTSFAEARIKVLERAAAFFAVAVPVPTEEEIPAIMAAKIEKTK